MKRLSPYFFLAIMLFNNLAVVELFKVHKLFEHYFEHVDRESKVTVLDFLTMHYFGKDINDDDQVQDMQLPFKRYDAKVSNYSYISIPLMETLLQPVLLTTINTLPFESSIYSRSNFASLFHPPQS